jgi:hypothetical protein
MNNKTLIGRENYLFLINDGSNEIEKHCVNNLSGNINIINNYKKYNNYYLIVYPDKSYIYNYYLPDNYKAVYRPIFNHYKIELNERILDCYEILKNEDNIYYKTDTHINLKGNYLVFNYFSDFVKKININIPKVDINKLEYKYVSNLTELMLGIGDLTWQQNLGNQILENTSDHYYYHNNDEFIYNKTIINDKLNLQFLILENNILLNKTDINMKKIIDWNILSDYILYRKNDIYNNNLKIIIFYDSFLINIIHLLLNLFREIYFIKDIFNEKYINIINPDYIFEFRVERFLF